MEMTRQKVHDKLGPFTNVTDLKNGYADEIIRLRARIEDDDAQWAEVASGLRHLGLEPWHDGRSIDDNKRTKPQHVNMVVAALTAQLAAAREALMGVMSFVSVTEESVGLAGETYPLRVCGIAMGRDVDELYVAARAALAAGKDAKP